MMEKNKRVLLGMSGDTGSFVAAIRLLEADYEVIGVTFHFYELSGSIEYLEDARSLVERSGVWHVTCDACEILNKQIIEYFVQEYLVGRTPAPCTLYNNYLKWPLLAKITDEMGTFYIATGCYVRNIQPNNIFYITYAAGSDEDQTFFLWGSKQDILCRTSLPMEDITKVEARVWTAEHGFRKVATKKDSVGICFCSMDYRTFLKNRLAQNSEVLAEGEQMMRGNQVLIGDRQILIGSNQTGLNRAKRGGSAGEKGDFIVWHEGYPFYTIRQRRGLGIHLSRPVFVKEISPEKNEVVLASLSVLEKAEMWLKDRNLVNQECTLGHSDIIMKMRHRKQENYAATAITPDHLLHVQLHEPLTAIVPGQAAVLYRDGLLLGGGIIVDAR